MELSPSSMTLLESRYLQPSETVHNLFKRVAQVVAECEKDDSWEQQFFEVMENFYFLPNTPTLLNAGKQGDEAQLVGTFVIEAQNVEQMKPLLAKIHTSGAGVGFSLDVCEKPLELLKELHTFAQENNGSYPRPAAHMATMRIDHPEILSFICAKENEGDLSTFNLSVALTDEFMRAYAAHKNYDLIDPTTGDKHSELNAQEVLNEIAQHMWKTGDPGIVYVDTINKKNTLKDQGNYATLDCCGEQPLFVNESSPLGSINLARMVEDGLVHWDRLRETVEVAVRFLDNVIDVNHYPSEACERIAKNNRKIGLGVMGFAELLTAMNISYGSKSAQEYTYEIMQFIQDAAYEATRQLAEEKGTFPSWETSFFAQRNDKKRNATVLAVSPTGSISRIAGCSSGIEPYFQLIDFESKECIPLLAQTCHKQGIALDVVKEHLHNNNSLNNCMDVPLSLRNLFSLGHDVPIEWQLKVLQAVQKYVGGGVSKTVNVPYETPLDAVRMIIILAHSKRCKGITVYRDGSRSLQVFD